MNVMNSMNYVNCVYKHDYSELNKLCTQYKQL